MYETIVSAVDTKITRGNDIVSRRNEFSGMSIERNSRRVNSGFTFQDTRKDRFISERNLGNKKRGKRRKKSKNSNQSFSVASSVICQIIFILLTFIHMELAFHIFTYRSLGKFIVYPIAFALPIGMFVLVITGLFKAKVNKIIMWVILGFTMLIFVAETIYMYVFKVPLLVTEMGAGNLQVLDYWKEILISFIKCMPATMLYAVPLVVYGILLKMGMRFVRKPIGVTFVFLIMALCFAFVPVIMVNLSDKDKNIIYENYHDMYDNTSAISDYGVFTTLRLNAVKLIKNDTGEVDLDELEIGTPAPTFTLGPKADEPTITDPDSTAAPVIDTSPNAMDIDFVKLAENEKNEYIKKLDQYFASLMPTRKNKYTGMFKGYNLIYLTGEAFSPYCVSKELTPTLYKLTHSGFVFNNYYVPVTGESTCGGEFMNISGLLTNPNRPRGVFTMQQCKNNYMPLTMGAQFRRAGVNTMAYHNNSYTYYGRNETIPAMGYTFKAGNGGSMDDSVARSKGYLFDLEHPKYWPQSDLEMMIGSGKEYITADKQFHAYYMTVSGHMLYTFTGNRMSSKNKDLVADLPYSEHCKAYIACNIELDRALENLLQQLEEAGVLDKTVICLSADHYPYGLTNEEIEEIVGGPVEENFELYRNYLLLYNSAMETVVIDKPCSSIDIIPTLSNLFGFTYDSRLLPGQDILSDSEGLVIMTSNRSFITDKVMYNSKTKKCYDLNGNEIDVDKDYITEMKKKINLKFTMNQLLIEHDYYRTLKKYFE